MGKYLFFDIDGTLLSDVTHTVPQSAIEAIKKAKENGHHCFFCTGRSYFMTKEISMIGIEDAIIANGAAVVRDGKPELQKIISSDVVKKTLELIEELGGGYQIIDWKMAIRILIHMLCLKNSSKRNLMNLLKKCLRKRV